MLTNPRGNSCNTVTIAAVRYSLTRARAFTATNAPITPSTAQIAILQAHPPQFVRKSMLTGVWGLLAPIEGVARVLMRASLYGLLSANHARFSLPRASGAIPEFRGDALEDRGPESRPLISGLISGQTVSDDDAAPPFLDGLAVPETTNPRSLAGLRGFLPDQQ